MDVSAWLESGVLSDCRLRVRLDCGPSGRDARADSACVFRVHRAFLARYSKFFFGLFTSPLSLESGACAEIELPPRVSMEAFRLVLEWIYGKPLTTDQDRSRTQVSSVCSEDFLVRAGSSLPLDVAVEIAAIADSLMMESLTEWVLNYLRSALFETAELLVPTLKGAIQMGPSASACVDLCFGLCAVRCDALAPRLGSFPLDVTARIVVDALTEYFSLDEVLPLLPFDVMVSMLHLDALPVDCEDEIYDFAARHVREGTFYQGAGQSVSSEGVSVLEELMGTIRLPFLSEKKKLVARRHGFIKEEWWRAAEQYERERSLGILHVKRTISKQLARNSFGPRKQYLQKFDETRPPLLLDFTPACSEATVEVSIDAAEVGVSGDQRSSVVASPKAEVVHTTVGVRDSAACSPGDSWSTRPSDVLGAILDYFEHISFRKGWRTLPLSRQKVVPLLHLSSCLICCIRSELDRSQLGELKIRVLDGMAREHLHTLQRDPTSISEECALVLGVVIAAFKDAYGFVEGLTEESLTQHLELAIVRTLPLPGNVQTEAVQICLLNDAAEAQRRRKSASIGHRGHHVRNSE